MSVDLLCVGFFAFLVHIQLVFIIVWQIYSISCGFRFLCVGLLLC